MCPVAYLSNYISGVELSARVNDAVYVSHWNATLECDIGMRKFERKTHANYSRDFAKSKIPFFEYLIESGNRNKHKEGTFETMVPHL